MTQSINENGGSFSKFLNFLGDCLPRAALLTGRPTSWEEFWGTCFGEGAIESLSTSPLTPVSSSLYPLLSSFVLFSFFPTLCMGLSSMRCCTCILGSARHSPCSIAPAA